MINGRALFITSIVLVVFVGLIIQLYTIQIGGHDEYKHKADHQQNRTYAVKAERGIFYDRNKEILAYTKDDVSLFADSRMLNRKANRKRRNKIAETLAKVFNEKPQKYLNLIKKSKKDVCLERKIPKDKALLLNNLVVDGFYKREDYTRVYPYGHVASHVLGYVDKDSEGQSGLEKMYNNLLKGKDGELFVENDVIGRTVSIDYDNSVSSISGDSFVLTLNKVYQKILVNELINGVETYQGKSAIGIIANPNTGEILALANVPDFDPKNYHTASNFQRRNRALTDTYEPGSTMKSIVLAMLFEEGLAKEQQVINTENGKYRIKGAWIRDTHKNKKLTVAEVLEESSNIGMVKLSDRIDDRDFYKGLRDFGFGNLTSVDMLGETKGYLKKPNQYSGITKAFISHGYEVSVTPMQMVSAYSALINGGNLYEPRILKRIIDSNGEVEEEFEKTKIRRVISEETSDRIREIMLGVVEHGTGKNAQLENVFVGGKTGTAQKLIDGKYSRKYNSSFIGFFPAENPQVICFVLVDSPEKGKYGGQVAAPIFKNISKKIMDIDFDIERKKNKIEREELLNNFIADIEASNSKVDQLALQNYTDKKNRSSVTKITRTTMPNLINKSLREAISILSDLKIQYKINGNGKVKSQSIKKGEKIKAEMVCKIVCTSKTNISIK
ncbi:MAG: transpeptidase family protein [Ignavibacteriae bacterium]|nr:transpeptidase family protein [Ignavibacteriota bacterium]